MKALPLWQPWASLVAIGEKRVETRGYPPTRLGLGVGERLAIYATKGGEPKGYELDWLDRHPRALQRLAEHLDVQSRPDWVREALPRGAIVCTCLLERASQVVPATAEHLARLKPLEFSYGDYDLTDGRERWAWVLREVELFTPAIPATTRQQGAFDWTPPHVPPAPGSPLHHPVQQSLL